MPSPVPVRKSADAEPFTWADACAAILIGRRVTRQAWNDPQTVVFLHAGAVHLRKADGTLHTLIVSEGDLSAADWQVVREH